jgi:hypothetical protein
MYVYTHIPKDNVYSFQIYVEKNQIYNRRPKDVSQNPKIIQL